MQTSIFSLPSRQSAYWYRNVALPKRQLPQYAMTLPEQWTLAMFQFLVLLYLVASFVIADRDVLMDVLSLHFRIVDCSVAWYGRCYLPYSIVLCSVCNIISCHSTIHCSSWVSNSINQSNSIYLGMSGAVNFARRASFFTTNQRRWMWQIVNNNRRLSRTRMSWHDFKMS